MQALSALNIESELSYAYLHAVAAKAGFACEVAGRHSDSNGIDATLTAWGPFVGGGFLQEVDLKIQLKATVATPADHGDTLSYFFKGRKQYDDLRSQEVATPRLLVVLFLPAAQDQWLCCSAEQLMLRRCAYWVSLRGAPALATDTGGTVQLPKAQAFTDQALTRLVTRLSQRDIPLYGASS